MFTEMYSCQQKNIVLCIEVLSHDSRRKRDVLDNHQTQNDEDYSEDGERFVAFAKDTNRWELTFDFNLANVSRQNPFIESFNHKYLMEEILAE